MSTYLGAVSSAYGEAAGPYSTFQVVLELYATDTGSGYDLTLRRYLKVVQGVVGFDGTVVTTNWGTYTISTGGIYAQSDLYIGTLAYGQYYDSGEYSAYYTGGSGTTYRSSTRLTYTVPNTATYTVTYNGNGGTNVANPQTKYAGQPLTLSNTLPHRYSTIKYIGNGGDSPESKDVRWTFKNWNTKPDGTGTSYDPGRVYDVDSDVILYAQWINPTVGELAEPSDSKGFTITFNANGGSVNPTSKRFDCEFQGWYTRSSGGVQITSETVVTGNLTIYAHWEDVPARDLPVPSRYNCKFVCWTTTLNGSIEFTSDTVISANTVVYAKYKYKITLNANGGVIYDVDSGQAGQTIDLWKYHGVDLILPDYLVTYTESDPDEAISKKFAGYSLLQNGASADYVVGSKFSIDKPTELYAVWEYKTYTVTFLDGYSNTVLHVESNVKHGSSVTPPPDPVRSGYTFYGWSGNYTYVTSDRKIVAMWEFNPIWIRTSDGRWEMYNPKGGA